MAESLPGDLFLHSASKSSTNFIISLRTFVVKSGICHTVPHQVLGVSRVLPDVGSKHRPHGTSLSGSIWSLPSQNRE